MTFVHVSLLRNGHNRAWAKYGTSKRFLSAGLFCSSSDITHCAGRNELAKLKAFVQPASQELLTTSKQKEFEGFAVTW